MALRCIEYCSRADPTLRESEIEALLDFSAAKNAASGVTGWLLCENGLFIELIEGEASDIAALWTGIQADHRHTQILVLRDEPIPFREFDGWSRRRMAPFEADSPQTPVDRATAALGAQLEEVAHRESRLSDLLTAGAGDSVVEVLRTAPTQNRSVITVDQLLDSAEASVAVNGAREASRLGDLASDAAISDQVAYRYFPDGESAIRAAVRRRQASALETLLKLMRGRRFETLAEVAAFIVAMQLRMDSAWPPMLSRVRLAILRRYHETPYEAIVDACRRLGEGRGGALLGLDPDALAMAIVAVASAVKAVNLTDAGRLKSPEVKARLANLALAALGEAGLA